jgi:hypothetical protein
VVREECLLSFRYLPRTSCRTRIPENRLIEYKKESVGMRGKFGEVHEYTTLQPHKLSTTNKNLKRKMHSLSTN